MTIAITIIATVVVLAIFGLAAESQDSGGAAGLLFFALIVALVSALFVAGLLVGGVRVRSSGNAAVEARP